MKYDRIIGIDPGVHTGYAVWDGTKITTLATYSFSEAQNIVRWQAANFRVKVRVEDARLRRWFGKSGRERLQGAGSIKRDSGLWEEFLKSIKVDYEMVNPASVKTKLKAEPFAKLTGYKFQTNQHERDAGMLIYDYSMTR